MTSIAPRPEYGDHDGWTEVAARASTFTDERLRRLLGDIHGRIGGGIPHICQDWAAVRAPYRFLSNRKVSEGAMLACHFEATRARFQGEPGTVLILHGTTEFVFQREREIGFGLLTGSAGAVGGEPSAGPADAIQHGPDAGWGATEPCRHSIPDPPSVQGRQRS